MKIFFAFLFISIVAHCNAQTPGVTLFIRDQAINVTLEDEDNQSKIFQLNSSQFSDNDVLKIKVADIKDEKELKRSFFIYDTADNDVKDFAIENNTYAIRFGELKQLLKPQQTYYVYTVAIPKDPQKAMLVKPARKLVCSIKIH